MATPFELEVVTPTQRLFAGAVTSLQVPAWEGYLGVLANHAPMLCVLREGVLTARNELTGVVHVLAVKGGFLEVGDNHVLVLADDAVCAAGLAKKATADSVVQAPPEADQAPWREAQAKAVDQALEVSAAPVDKLADGV